MAFVFPGQNSHFVGMGKDLWELGGVARSVLASADKVLGSPLTELMFEGPAEVLTATQNQQPAILAHSAACLALLEQRGTRPSLVAGHSLGEYSALIAAGCLGFRAALQLVRKRGELMAEAGGGAMAAIIGVDATAVARACAQAEEVGFVAIANHNCPGQLVITGEPRAVGRAGELLKEAGAKRVVPLRVSGAFHSPLMQSAADQLREILSATSFSDARVPLVGNVDATPRTCGAAVREALAAQMVSPVLWEASVRRMVEEGTDTFVEVGPGNVVSGLVRRIAPNARVEPAGTPDQIASLAL